MKIKIVKCILIFIILIITIIAIYNKYFTKYKTTTVIHPNVIITGKTHLQDSSIIICGLIRDGEKNIEHIKKLTYSILDGVKKYKVLIVENDSVDNTRKLLLEWSMTDPNIVVLGCGVNVDKCNINLSKSMGTERDITRIGKMVYLRNIYMDYITKNLTDYDYTIMCDFDIYGVLYSDGLYDTFYKLMGDKTINVIGVNSFKYNTSYFSGSKNYNDTYAYVGIEYKNCLSDISCHEENDDDIFGAICKRDKIDKLLKNNTSLLPVSSCFGGLCVYRTSCVLGKKYDTFLNSQSIALCEHVGLNLQIPNIYINPLFEYLIVNNP